MNHSSPNPSGSSSFLELLTGFVLCLVLMAIGWMVVVTLIPNLPRMLSIEMEVGVMVGLLAASLGLVSAVALIHTR